ncbi:MAG: acetylglutamate kinase [Bdellovibrio sp.]|nr:acetylglutamate kinase [Bdellovibrio sp.]
MIVIKFGGEVAESSEGLSNLIHSVARLHGEKQDIVLVHGGGPQATLLSRRLNLEPVMVGGRRVTDQETLEVMKMTLPGVINSNVLAMIHKFKLPGVSVSGIGVVRATKRPPKAVSGSEGKLVDFGLVGDIVEIRPKYLQYLVAGRYIPVLSPLCCDDDGTILNINADTVAVQIAQVLKADKLVLITQIGGVFEDIHNPQSKYAVLKMSDAQEKIKKGIIKGGMIPKLEEGFKLLKEDLDSFHIVGVESPETILNEINRPGSCGTAIVRG